MHAYIFRCKFRDEIGKMCEQLDEVSDEMTRYQTSVALLQLGLGSNATRAEINSIRIEKLSKK